VVFPVRPSDQEAKCRMAVNGYSTVKESEAAAIDNKDDDNRFDMYRCLRRSVWEKKSCNRNMVPQQPQHGTAATATWYRSNCNMVPQQPQHGTAATATWYLDGLLGT